MRASSIHSVQFLIQIPPQGIGLLNQLQLPAPVPFFYGFLPLNRTLHRLVGFIPNQHMHAILFRKSFNLVILMLPDTFDEIRGNPDVKSSITTAGENIYAGKFRHSLAALDSRLRGNDKREAMKQMLSVPLFIRLARACGHPVSLIPPISGGMSH